jgi:hypothetical protein
VSIRRNRTDEPLAQQGTALYGLLRDASAPAREDELAGMSQATTWFAGSTPAGSARSSRSRAAGIVAALVATKTALGATAAAAAVGVASVGAATGTLPAPAQDAAHAAFGAPASDNAERKAAAAAERAADKAAREAERAADDAAAAAPSPSMVGLCRAYAHVKDSSGKALENPAFTALLTEGGGSTGVDAFCTTTLADAEADATEDHGKSDESSRPADAGKPDGAGKPDTTGKPEVTGRPDGAGQPSTTPATGRPSETGRPDSAGRP